MIDASKGFIKDGNKNRLRAQDIHRIVDTFVRQQEVPKYARMVPLAEIEGNDFNLNLPRYIDSSEPEDLQDIEAHLRGGIPEADIDGLAPYWKVLPGVRAELFAPANRPGYWQTRVDAAQVKPAIFGHPEFTAFQARVAALFDLWQEWAAPVLTGLQQGLRPNALIEDLSERLLATFRSDAAVASLVDPYGVYQHLMDYWDETLHDDAWMISADGWQALQDGKPNVDLIPPDLVVARYFAADRKAIDALEAQREALARQLEELEEEHGGEGGLLFEAQTEKGKLTRGGVKARLAAALEGGADVAVPGEIDMLRQYLDLIEQEAAAARKVKEVGKALDAKVAARYKQLAPADIQQLVVHDKWLAALRTRVDGELDRVSQALAGRVKQLAERYARPLPQLVEEVAALSAKVDEHLRKMGFAW